MKGIEKEGLMTDAFFQTVFQTSPDAAIVTRVCDATILHVNDNFCRITGYAREEVVGKTTLELSLYFDPSDRETFLKNMEQTGILETRSTFFRKRDGGVYSALISARSFWLDGVQYVCASIQDTSEARRIEREHSERDEELRRLFETMAQGVVYQDPEGNIVFANPAAERMLGLNQAQLYSRASCSPEWKAIYEDGTPMPCKEHPSMIALRTGKPFGPQILAVYNQEQGAHIWLSVCATPLFHKGEDKPYQAYIIMEDITEARRARQDFQQLFCGMVDATAVHEIICDESGTPVDYRFLAVNPAFERMTGFKADDMVGKRVLEVLPDTEAYWIETYGQVALSGNAITFRNYSSAIDKYFNVTAYSPAPKQFACTFTDITSEIRLQREKESMQEQATLLAHIADVAPSSIIVFDETGKVLYANEYTSRLHGYAKNELLTMNISDLTYVQGGGNLHAAIQDIKAQGEHVTNQTGLKKNGEQIPLLIYTKSIDWDGTPAFLSIGTDLSEQKKAEKNLLESHIQMQRILDNLQDGFFRAELNGRFLMLNPRMARIYGYASVEDMLETTTQNMYADPQDREMLFQKLQAEGHVTSMAFRGKKRDGSLIWTSMHVQYLKNDAGEPIGTEGLIRDITERRKLEQEIEQQHESLKATNEVLKKRLEQSINAISKIVELRDVYTSGHQKRVKQLACQIGERCGMSSEAITNLSYGALIHDIGKIYIASDILNKPGKITNLEYQILQTHAEYSYNIAEEMDLPQVILDMVLQHHERLDGSGYPNHLKGDEIILESRILAVADVVEAMTSHRPYRPALGIDAALNEIQSGKGTKYDARVVDLCVNLFRTEGFVFSNDPVS